jgi:hypothetical protein
MAWSLPIFECSTEAESSGYDSVGAWASTEMYPSRKMTDRRFFCGTNSSRVSDYPGKSLISRFTQMVHDYFLKTC